MYLFIVTTIACLGLIFISIIIVGEFIAMDYPNGNFAKWWRKHLIYNENDNKDINENQMHNN
jgi:hypothetical protein